MLSWCNVFVFCILFSSVSGMKRSPKSLRLEVPVLRPSGPLSLPEGQQAERTEGQAHKRNTLEVPSLPPVECKPLLMHTFRYCEGKDMLLWKGDCEVLGHCIEVAEDGMSCRIKYYEGSGHTPLAVLTDEEDHIKIMSVVKVLDHDAEKIPFRKLTDVFGDGREYEIPPSDNKRCISLELNLGEVWDADNPKILASIIEEIRESLFSRRADSELPFVVIHGDPTDSKSLIVEFQTNGVAVKMYTALALLQSDSVSDVGYLSPLPFAARLHIFTHVEMLFADVPPSGEDV